MMISVAEAEERVANLVVLCSRLGLLLTEETKAFEARRPRDIAADQPETQRLANLYRHETARIRAEPDLVLTASAESRRRLMGAVQQFETIVARHGRAVTAAKIVSEGLVQAIATEVAAQRESASPYGQGSRSASGSASAIVLNRQA